ncbi:MAG: paraquat-inducible protein A [Sulfurovum sp.]|nr:paraquat-inducible protein A [Sulfurovum sp.]
MSERIICCHACDELVKVSDPQRDGRFKCPVCGSLLFRHKKGMVEKMFALSLAALILFVVTNYFPFLSFHVAGNTSHANFFTSVQYLFEEQEWLLGTAILMTTLAIPLMRIVLFLLLFVPLYFGHLPRYSVLVLKVLDHSTPWGMLDVFLVGVFVSLVKLAKMGMIIPGTSLWAFMGLVFVLASMQVIYNPHEIWEMISRKKELQVQEAAA